MQALDLGPHRSACWIALVAALALHVIDEALTGFLPFYNAAVESARESFPWLSIPTLTFSAWLSGLTILVLVLFSLTPLVAMEYLGTWLLCYFLGALMLLNGLGHVAASVWLDRAAPGVYSAPVLLLTSIALLVSTYQSGRSRRLEGGAKQRRSS